LQTVKNVIFDFGGVIIDLDFSKTYQAFRTLLGEGLETFFAKHEQHPVFRQLELGQITPAVFRKEVMRLVGKQVPQEDFDTAWNALLRDIQAEKVWFLQRLAQQKRIFLLSNTNQIHQEFFEAYFAKAFPEVVSLSQLFEKVYYSHKMGMRKPDPAIFLKVLEMNGLHPSETLFVDDSEQHIASARYLGMQTLHIKGGKKIQDLLTL